MAQDETEVDKWDNTLYFGNKVVFGGVEEFKHSHELQWRAEDNLNAMDQFFYEGVFTYSPNRKWELVPDFRITKKPYQMEYRPGIGVIRKQFFGLDSESGITGQLVHQAKYQADITSDGEVKHGLRYVVTYNHFLSEKVILTGLAGPFWRFSENFSGLQFIRGGVGATIIFDHVHTLSLINAFGMEDRNDGQGWYGSWIPIIQLVIRVNKDYRYVPASYINF